MPPSEPKVYFSLPRWNGALRFAVGGLGLVVFGACVAISIVASREETRAIENLIQTHRELVRGLGAPDSQLATVLTRLVFEEAELIDDERWREVRAVVLEAAKHDATLIGGTSLVSVEVESWGRAFGESPASLRQLDHPTLKISTHELRWNEFQADPQVNQSEFRIVKAGWRGGEFEVELLVDSNYIDPREDSIASYRIAQSERDGIPRIIARSKVDPVVLEVPGSPRTRALVERALAALSDDDRVELPPVRFPILQHLPPQLREEYGSRSLVTAASVDVLENAWPPAPVTIRRGLRICLGGAWAIAFVVVLSHWAMRRAVLPYIDGLPARFRVTTAPTLITAGLVAVSCVLVAQGSDLSSAVGYPIGTAVALLVGLLSHFGFVRACEELL